MKYLHLIFLCIALTACTPSNNNEIELDGTRWTLQFLNGRELRANTIITLKFDAENVYGRGGCNNYGAKYTIQPENGFTVSEGGWTEMACPEPEGVMEQESEYVSSFWSVTSYKIDGTTLSLANEQEEVLLQYQLLPKFEVNPEDLTGKTWLLVSATGLENIALNAFTLQLDGSKLRGTTTCRAYEGMYQANGDSLNILSMSMGTNITCSKEDNFAEANYISLLSTTWQYNVSETQLELYTENGKKMFFELAGQK